MHYYKRNIGDYAKKAARLTMLQHGAYTLLIDSCYDREEFPTLDDAIDWCWASTQEEVDAVTFVLNKFFDLKDGVFVQKRISQELAQYHKNADTNKRIAIDRETKRREKSTKREQLVNEAITNGHEAPPNQEPLTKNQEPLTNKKTTRFTPPSLDEVICYFREKGDLDPTGQGESFFNFYESKGWLVGKTKMKSWKASVSGWMSRNKLNGKKPNNQYLTANEKAGLRAAATEKFESLEDLEF